MNQGPTKIIALCGIDGAGKSTVLDHLERRAILPDAVCVRMRSSPNFDRVKQVHRREHRDGREWIGGAFAASAAYAWALDYLDVRVDLVYDRFRQRGGPTEDENPYVIPLFSQAYEQVLAASSRRVLRVPNNGDLADMLTAVEERLREWSAIDE